MGAFDSIANTIDRDNRNMQALGAPNRMSDILSGLQADIDAGNIGITANAWDVDALAGYGGGAAFAVDIVNTNLASLNFAYLAGRSLWNGKTIVNTAGATIALTASSTNYVEVDNTGTVSKNTVGFTANRIPLYVIVTGIASITSITNKKNLLCSNSLAGVTGDQLSQAASTKSVNLFLGTLLIASFPYKFRFVGPAGAAKLAAANFSSHIGQAVDNANYVTFKLTNITNANAVQLAATAANTTQATGGSAIVADARRDLVLTGTSADLNTAGGDIYEIEFDKTGTPPADLTLCTFKADFSFTN